MPSPFVLLQHLLPHHGLSRLVARFADSPRDWIRKPLIRWFAARYQVDLREAVTENLDDYPTFNAFFTRALKPGARPVTETAGVVVCPADGVVSALGPLLGDTLIQAKGRDYSLVDLLGGDHRLAAPFLDGSFVTVYLSPRDYHRVHMPFDGELIRTVYIPGRLFSVNDVTTAEVPRLFARNERLVCLFDTALGPVAQILVGAMIVAGIDTVWSGQESPSPRGIRDLDQRHRVPPVHLRRGDEMGRFRLGSTVITVFGPGAVTWAEDLKPGTPVRMGRTLAQACGNGRRP